jgi:HlyD family secretion protein
MSRKNILITLAVILVAGAVVGANLYYRRDTGVAVTTETIKTRDLEAIVSASGKIQPKLLVNITAETAGRVVNLAVNEGDRIKVGQFLMQIDPKLLRSRVDNSEASLQVAAASLEQLRQAVETAKVQLEQARQTLARQQGLWKQQLTTRADLEKAENDVKTGESSLAERDKSAKAQDSRIMQERASLDSARYDLSKVRIQSPIEGIVTRRNIQEGETAMIGTMNNAGTVLLTLADMSVIQAEVEVDETNIPNVQLGQHAKITIDAIPDKTFKGHVTEIGNSPIQAAAGATSSTQATNFKVVVVLDEQVPEVRPGFTCTADITTATRKNVAAVPIPSVAVRELIYDAGGQVVKEPKDTKRRRRTASSDSSSGTSTAKELQPGQTRKETEGVFVFRDKDKAVEFVPVKMGIAGDKYFELLAGLKPGDQVVTGPYNSVRNIADGDPVKVDNKQSQGRSDSGGGVTARVDR